jgi:repressor LexA
MPEPLNTLERRVYQYMIDFLAENTYQPSIREIAKKFRIKSTKTVSDLLHSLSSKGYIERDQSRSRGVRILGFAAAGHTQPVPCYDRVAASGSPLVAENRSSYITLDRRFLPSDDTFIIRAPDREMEGRAIMQGDYVLVSGSARAKDGDTVAIRVRGETMIRTLTHRGMSLVLESAAGTASPIELGPKDDFNILGVVCGVFRPMYDQPVSTTNSDESLATADLPPLPDQVS